MTTPTPKSPWIKALLGILATCLVLSCMYGTCDALLGDDGEGTSNSRGQNAAPPAPPAPTALPVEQWQARVVADCDDYSAALNDIVRTTVHARNQGFVRAMRISESQGTIKSISTYGTQARIRIEAGDLKLAHGDIPAGSPIYTAAGSMAEGACVVFSARIIEANGITERMEVCGRDYDVTFTSLTPCPASPTTDRDQ